MEKYSDDPSERQYAAIGKVASEWAHVEDTLRFILETHLDIEAPGVDSTKISILTVELGSTGLLNALYAILHECREIEGNPSYLYEHFKTLEPRIIEERGKRNTIVHNSWFRDGPRGNLFAWKSSAKGKYKHFDFHKTAREIEEVAASIRELRFLLWRLFREDEAGRLAPLLPKPRQQQPKRRNPH